jgi:RNA polymerase sigma-70 factor (ECF subfamily)
VTERLALSEESFAELHARSHRSLRRYLIGMTGSVEIAEDLLQEAYLRLLTRAPGSLAHQQLVRYLYTVATRLANDYFRHRKVEARWQERPAGEPPRDGTEGERSDLLRALGRLTLRQRTLLWLAYVEELSHREIAGILDLGERSVRVLLARSRRRLEKILRESGVDGGRGR